MNPSEKDLVRVTSAAELRGGMWIFVKALVGKNGWFFLTRSGDPWPCGHRDWRTVTVTILNGCKLSTAIAKGCIFKLRDPDAQEEREQSIEQPREVVS